MNPNVYMLLFCTSLTITYAIVRLNKICLTQAFVIGSIVNSAFFVLYAMAHEDSISKAIAFGLLLGLVFTAVIVTLGRVFRSTDPIHVENEQVLSANSIHSNSRF